MSLLRAQPYGSGYKYTVEALCTVDFDGTQFAAGDIIPDVLDSFLKPFVETNVDDEEEEEECDEASIVTNDSDSEDGDASSDDDDDLLSLGAEHPAARSRTAAAARSRAARSTAQAKKLETYKKKLMQRRFQWQEK